MSAADEAMLKAAACALSAAPFAAVLTVQGVTLGRDTVRAIERDLLRQRAGLRRGLDEKRAALRRRGGPAYPGKTISGGQ